MIKLAKRLIANNNYEMQWDTILNQLQVNKKDLLVQPFDTTYYFYISAKILHDNYGTDYEKSLDDIINSSKLIKEAINNILTELNNHIYFENAEVEDFYIGKNDDVNISFSLNLNDKVFKELIDEFNKISIKDMNAVIKADEVVDNLIFEEKKIIFDHIKNDYKNIVLRIF